MKPTSSRISGSAAGCLLLAGFGLLLSLAMLPSARSEDATPPQAPKKAQAAPAKPAPVKAAPAKATPKKAAAPTKRAEAPRGQLRRRDPFRSLVVSPEELGGRPLPPGKPGLVIAQLNLNGIVLMRDGKNIAVVTMLGRNRAYFLRARDELFDGYVSQINPDNVVFKEKATDPFGKEYEREVVKQLPALGAKR